MTDRAGQGVVPGRRGRAAFEVVAVAIVAAGLVLTGCRGGIVAQTQEDVVEHSFDLAAMSAPPHVSVTTFNGNVVVKAGPVARAEARVTKRAQAPTDPEAKDLLDQIEVTFDQLGTDVVVKVTRSEQPTGPRSTGADVEITVPAASSIEVGTSNGSVDVSGLENTASIETSNGRVSLAGRLAGADVVSSNGGISVDGATGRLALETSNAAIRVTATDAVIDAETSNAAITFAGSLAAGVHRFESSNNRITLTLPADAAFTIDARTSSNKVTCAFPVPDGAPDDDAVLTGALPGGEAVRITAHTSNGNIRIEQAK